MSKPKSRPKAKKRAAPKAVKKTSGANKSGVIREFLNPNFGYFYNYKKVLARKKTKFQELKVIQTQELGRVLLLDGVTQVAEKNDYLYHEPMVHPALLAHPNPTDVLIIGGGDGGVAREVLRHPSVERVTQVDIDGDVYTFSEEHLPFISQKALQSPRVKKIVADGRAWVSQHHTSYDVVIMDMTDPFGPARMLYTSDFFRLVKKSFKNPGEGLFVMHAESPISRPKTYNSILQTLETTFSYVNPFYLYIQMYATLWCVAISSDRWDLRRFEPGLIDEKIEHRNLGALHCVNGQTFQAMQAEYPYIKKIRGESAKVLTDRDPEPEDEIRIN